MALYLEPTPDQPFRTSPAIHRDCQDKDSNPVTAAGQQAHIAEIDKLLRRFV